MGRLSSGSSPLMDNHYGDQIGVIESAVIGSDRKGKAKVRFGKSARAQEIFQDVQDGIRSNVSVGYDVHRLVLEEERDKEPSIYRAMDWEPYEISIVSIPADIGVGVGRVKEKREHETIFQRREIMPVEQEVKIDVEKIKADAIAGAQTRANEIIAIGETHKCQELARKFLLEGKSVDEFRKAVLEEVLKAKPITTPNADLGLSERDQSEYSLLRAIRQIAENGKLDGIEREASDATAKKVDRQPQGFFLPTDIMSSRRVGNRQLRDVLLDLVEKRPMMARALGVSTAAGGNLLVDAEVMGANMIELLRNKTLVAQLGARSLSGLTGNVLLPKLTAGGQAYWLPETGSVTENSQTLGQLGLTPKRLAADTLYSKELLIQASIDVEAMVREDLMLVLAIAKDLAAINGAGNNGQPLGIINTTGIKTVTFGAAATWAKAVSFETQIANANADRGQMAFLTTPATRGAWKTAPKAAGYPIYLWENSSVPGEGTVNGYRACATVQVPSDKVVFGNWNDLILADWAGVDVVVDPYSAKKTGQIEVTINLWTDVGVRHPVSFCVSTDSGAQ